MPDTRSNDFPTTRRNHPSKIDDIWKRRLAHRVVGYLEEEAIHSYTEYLKDIDYWRLPNDSTLKDVITVIRADEAHHRDVNHFASSAGEKKGSTEGITTKKFQTIMILLHLHGTRNLQSAPYDKKCDVYSFGIILNELITADQPYTETDYGSSRFYAFLHSILIDLAMEVVKNGLRPMLPLRQCAELEEIIALIQYSWDENAATRPSFVQSHKFS